MTSLEQGTGYSITEAEFRQIISDPPWQDIARPLLKRWFGYEIAGEREAAAVRSASGKSVDLAELYQRIQGDPQMQYDLYQRAMNFWR
jgi:hypothetical protein